MQKTILVVDDSPSVRRMVSMTLKGAGFAVVEADDGRAALAAAERSLPDIIITDQNMPNLDGIGFIKAFRALPQSAGVPVIFLSTETEDAIKAQARAVGAIGWMTKPFNDEKLLSVVKRVAG
ncbi:response regulator [Poseidonocella sp. HB161398]|uniref:response regulator n=1 Tax=Poseidonocella sp. HB161398 TaxID=2320855 RepID=UPI00110924EA|nr:response regulator [Poseidonocella sp. HB161398]